MAYDDDENLPPIEFTAAGDTPEQREEILELVEPLSLIHISEPTRPY